MITFLLFSTDVCLGQTDSIASDSLVKKSRLKYANQFLFTTFFNENEIGSPHLGVSTFHGIRDNRAAAGIVVSYYYFEQWTILSPGIGICYDVLQRRNSTLYVQLNGAYSKLYYHVDNGDAMNRNPIRGSQMEGLLGYRFQLKGARLYLAGGIRRQALKYRETPHNWIWGWPASQTTVARTVNGAILQIGFGI